jgi:glutathione S-transferase
MCLVEKGLTPDVRQVSIRDGAQLSPEFLAVNPRGTVPVLVTEGGTVLTENQGIVAYLDAAFPEVPLLGRTPDERGLVAMWTALTELQGGQPIAEALRNGNPHMKGRALTGPADVAQIPELAARGMARVAGFFDLLETRLQESPYLATDHLTFADISAFVFVDFARVIKRRIPEGNAATLDWFERISARESAQA